MTTQTCIIIGGGHAAAKLAGSLREQGWKGQIIMICAEDSVPYHRPPLSKDFLTGARNRDDVMINTESFYQDNDIEVLTGRRVVRIDRKAKTVVLEGGDKLHYDKLALATGARVRKLAAPGSGLDGAFYLRTLEDAERIRSYAKKARNAVILGGGYIGLEAASSLRAMGLDVTVMEPYHRIMRRVTTEEVSGFFERIHEEEGVVFRKNMIVNRIEGDKGRVNGVFCDDGNTYPADLVVIGIGVIPETELAERAGLTVDSGIFVDEHCQTSDPDIVAAGDCTEFDNAFYGRPVRLESVQNALDQAEVAAASIVGKKKAYTQLPWFWSNQYDVKLQIAGLNTDFDQIVVRGELKTGRKASVFYLRDNRIISVYAMNTPPDFALGKRLIEQSVEVDAERLSDPNTPLKDFMLPRKPVAH